MSDEIGRAWRGARARGAGAQTQVSRVIFGSRRDPAETASQAHTQKSAIGTGPRSVFSGPARAAQPGAPILRRAKP